MSIEGYEFSDMYEPKVLSANSVAVALDTNGVAWIALNKNDVIALAKHFKLTREDLS